MPAFVFPHTETVMQGGNHSIYSFQQHICHEHLQASSLGCSRLKIPFDYDPSRVYRFEEFEAFDDWLKTHDFEAFKGIVRRRSRTWTESWTVARFCQDLSSVGIPRFPFQVTYFCLITSNPSLLLQANPAPSPAPARPWSESSSNLLCFMWPNFRYVDVNVASCGGCFYIQNLYGPLPGIRYLDLRHWKPAFDTRMNVKLFAIDFEQPCDLFPHHVSACFFTYLTNGAAYSVNPTKGIFSEFRITCNYISGLSALHFNDGTWETVVVNSAGNALIIAENQGVCS